MLLNQVKQINPLLNPKPVELGIGRYTGTEGSQANTNLSNISNVLPFALPMATMGLISQAPNVINKEISAQDVIDNHLNRDVHSSGAGYIFTPPEQEIVNTELPLITPEYQTYDESFITPDSRVVDQGFITPDTQFQDEGFITPSSADMTTLYNKGLLGEEVIEDGLLSETAPPFYSKITKTIEDAQMNKASGDGWMGMINNSGVNQEELDWIGMKDFLADKKSVTKEEILDFARMNDLSTEVKEVILSDKSKGSEKLEKLGFQNESSVLGLMENIDNGTYPKVAEDFEKWVVANQLREDGDTRPLFEYRSQRDDALQGYLERKLDITKSDFKNETYFSNSKDLITEGDYTDYKEMTFALPNIEGEYYLPASHGYKDKNIFAHARFNTRDIDGKKTLFIEELQSDWVHKGKNVGFKKDDNKYFELRKEQQRLFEIKSNIAKDIEEQVSDGNPAVIISDGTAEQQKIYMDADNAYKEIENKLKATSNAVPDLPFKKNWQDIVLKRMIRYAAENGFDAIAMTGGNIQKDRYDLSKHIDTLTYNETTGSINGYKDGQAVLFEQGVTKDNLADYVGKEVAKKIQEAEYPTSAFKNVKMKRLSGLDLQVGGEGLGNMYDTIFNKSLKKIGKKHGAEVELKNINRKKSIFSKNARFNYKNTVLKDASNIEEALKLASNNKYLKDEFEIYLRVDKGDEISPEERKEILEQSTINGIKKSSSLMLNFLQEDYGLSADSVAHNELIKDDKLNMWYMNLTDSLKKQSIEAGMPIAFNKPVNPLFNYA